MVKAHHAFRCFNQPIESAGPGQPEIARGSWVAGCKAAAKLVVSSLGQIPAFTVEHQNPQDEIN